MAGHSYPGLSYFGISNGPNPQSVRSPFNGLWNIWNGESSSHLRSMGISWNLTRKKHLMQWDINPKQSLTLWQRAFWAIWSLSLMTYRRESFSILVSDISGGYPKSWSTWSRLNWDPQTATHRFCCHETVPLLPPRIKSPFLNQITRTWRPSNRKRKNGNLQKGFDDPVGIGL